MFYLLVTDPSTWPICFVWHSQSDHWRTLELPLTVLEKCGKTVIIIVYVPWWQGGSSPWWDELYRVFMLCMLLWLSILSYVLVGCGAGPRCIWCWLLLFLGCWCCWRIFHCCTLYTHLPGGGLRILLTSHNHILLILYNKCFLLPNSVDIISTLSNGRLNLRPRTSTWTLIYVNVKIMNILWGIWYQ